jgi:hypothetical protein
MLVACQQQQSCTWVVHAALLSSLLLSCKNCCYSVLHSGAGLSNDKACSLQNVTLESLYFMVPQVQLLRVVLLAAAPNWGLQLRSPS